MLMRGAVIVGSGSTGGLEYTFDITSFLITACALAFYLVYIIKKSDNELREMIDNVYHN
jgi:membrane protein implicated in regulation of membrane protease activity